MFSFLKMIDNYDDRKVDRYEDEEKGITVSTCSVSDSLYPYETAIKHPRYFEHFIVVANYNTKEEAQVGHNEWVEKMTAPELPTELIEIGQSEINRFVGCINRAYPRNDNVS